MSWLARQAAERPGTVALRAGEDRLIYAELAAAAGRASAALAAAGVAPGDRVAVRLRNRAEHAVAVHAVTWLGAVLVPLHPRLAAGEAAALLEAAGAALLVADPEDPPASAALPCPVLDAARLAEAGEGAQPAAQPAPQPDRGLHSVLFTSGTTGRPRPVPLTHGNHRASAAASEFNLGVRPEDDWLCPLPLAHVGGLAVLLRAVLQGTAVTLLEGFDPAAVAEHLRSGRITHASLVPTMLRRLLDASPGGAPLGSPRLRAVLVGGGPVEPELVERALARGLPVLGTYGMTETASQVATVPPEAADAKPGSAGPPLPGVELEIRTAEGEPAPPGALGEIHVRGSMVSAPCADEHGWLATGDLGRLDREGYLWVEGRRDGIVVTGGENVSTREVERVLRAHPGVAECAVVGLPDPEWGEAVAAAVVPREPAGGASADDRIEEWSAWCRERLAPFKVPKRWRIAAELPRTASGKIRVEEIRHLFEA